MRAAVLLSGTGRTLENLLACTARGELPLEIRLVLSSRPDVRGLQVARAAGIAHEVVPLRGELGLRASAREAAQPPIGPAAGGLASGKPDRGTPGASGARTSDRDSSGIFERLRREQIALVLLAGWLKRLGIPADFRGRVLNIHPALLPRHGGRGCYGHRVHEAVLAAGDRESGCTVHIVDDEYDHGPIILQERVPVLPGDDADTLAARVFAAECRAYPKAIRMWIKSRR